jgi:hypothetical protein
MPNKTRLWHTVCGGIGGLFLVGLFIGCLVPVLSTGQVMLGLLVLGPFGGALVCTCSISSSALQETRS